MTFEDLEQKVIKWAEDRLIFEQSNPQLQFEKLVEELHELGTALDMNMIEGNPYPNNYERFDIDFIDTEDGIGDMLVVLTMIAKLSGSTLSQCYERAYNQIKDRRGKMINGLFVKET